MFIVETARGGLVKSKEKKKEKPFGKGNLCLSCFKLTFLEIYLVLAFCKLLLDYKTNIGRNVQMMHISLTLPDLILTGC